VILNDNAAKIVLIGLLNHPLVTGQGSKGFLIAVVSSSILLPFILLAPVTGWFADRFSKREVLWYSLVAQIVIVMGFLFAFWLQSLPVALFFLAWLAVQSAFFGPAKMGIVKELVSAHQVPEAISWMELLGVGAILIGTLLGAGLFDLFQTKVDIGPWKSGVWTTSVLLLLALWALWIFRGVPGSVGQRDLVFRWSLFADHFRQISYLWERRALFMAGLGNAFFFGVGGVLYLTFVQYGEELHHGKAGSSFQAAILFAVLGISLGVGSYLVGRIHSKGIRLGMATVGMGVMSVGMGVATVGLFDTAWLIYTGLVIAGLGAGMFNVTVNAFLIDEAPADHRGRVISASNLLTNLSGLMGIGIYWTMRDIMFLSPGWQMVVLSVTTVVGAAVTWMVVYAHRIHSS
jgi:MFS family permease